MAKPNGKQGGIRLRRMNWVMITITVALAVALFVTVFSTYRSFKNLEQATARYTLARTDTANMQAGSDYLTDRVRTFVVTGNVDSAEDFFREVEVTRRRDLAMESMESALSGTDTARYLGEALQASNRLAESERYAMALAASGYEIDPASLPNALRTVTLTAEDEALSGEERLKKAMDLVFDETYQTYKQTIRDDIARCEKALLGETEDARQRGSQQLGMALTVQALLLMLLVMVVIVIVLCNGRLVFQPIEALVQAINKDVTTEESGAHELRIVARAYNQALAENQQNQERLAYRATHDALTGLYNRGAFEQARQRTRGRAQAMLIIDVDRFKIFNDEYGHDMGDRVLQKVASAIQNNFREEDYVCRFGGDEFTVIMVHATSAMRSLVEAKIESIRETLRNTSDGLPVITLSIGVAFSDRPDPTDDILKDADTALYATKERGRDGYTFYGDGGKGQGSSPQNT